MIPVDPRVRRQAGDTDSGGADVACGRRRDGASWLAWMSIRSGRYVPSSENFPGQPVALQGPQRPGGGVGPAAEFIRQFCFRRKPGPRRVFAAPDPAREHGVDVRVGLRVLPRIIQTSHTGSVTTPAPADFLCSIWNIRALPYQRVIYARVTTSPGRRRESEPFEEPADRTADSWRASGLQADSVTYRRGGLLANSANSLPNPAVSTAGDDHCAGLVAQPALR